MSWPIGTIHQGEVHALRWDGRALCGIVTRPTPAPTLTVDHVSCNRCRRILRMPAWRHYAR